MELMKEWNEYGLKKIKNGADEGSEMSIRIKKDKELNWCRNEMSKDWKR